MCRFLLMTAHEPYDTRQIIEDFAEMCRHRPGATSGGQDDGWGVAWWHEPEGWQRRRSVAPIWTEVNGMAPLPPTRQLVLHARSASFAQHKGNVIYNQPYLQGPYAFVFNGLIQGVRLPRRVPGSVGAEKLWWLVQAQLRQGTPPRAALQEVYALMARNSRAVRACNMGLSNGQRFVSYNGNPSGAPYYQLHQTQSDALRMVSSEPFGAWTWRS